jgi:hypothetical protein
MPRSIIFISQSNLASIGVGNNDNSTHLQFALRDTFIIAISRLLALKFF